jgi:hypothetical protein
MIGNYKKQSQINASGMTFISHIMQIHQLILMLSRNIMNTKIHI